MSDLPAKMVRGLAHHLTSERTPAWVQVRKDGTGEQWGGALDRYVTGSLGRDRSSRR